MIVNRWAGNHWDYLHSCCPWLFWCPPPNGDPCHYGEVADLLGTLKGPCFTYRHDAGEPFHNGP